MILRMQQRTLKGTCSYRDEVGKPVSVITETVAITFYPINGRPQHIKGSRRQYASDGRSVIELEGLDLQIEATGERLTRGN